MSRAKNEALGPTQLRNSVSVMFHDVDMEMIGRVAARYGMSKSAAVRLLTRSGAAQHDPSPPTEGTQND